MYTVQSFCSCTRKLMCGSGVDPLIGSEFGGLAGIMSGTAWVWAMRAFRMVSTTILQTYFITTGHDSTI